MRAAWRIGLVKLIGTLDKSVLRPPACNQGFICPPRRLTEVKGGTACYLERRKLYRIVANAVAYEAIAECFGNAEAKVEKTKKLMEN